MITTIEELDLIYINRERYTIDWAFNNAQEKLNKMTFDLVKEEDGSYLRDREFKKHKWYARIFLNALGFITVLEFILSVLLVYMVSEISHTGDVFLATRGFSISVILVFAFIKVFLEQYLIRPKVEAFGWQLYRKTVNQVKDFLHNIK